MKKPMFTKADEAEMDRLKLTKAERAAVVDYNVLTQLTQAERDKIAEDNALDFQQARKLEKAYNRDPALWRSKGLTSALVVTVAHRHFGDATTATRAIATYDGKVRDMSKPGDTELEHSLVENVGLCLIRLQAVEAAYPERGNLKLIDFWDRHLAAAERRYQNACLTLARVRRLALPVLLLNIADKQQVIVGPVSKAPKVKG